MCCLVLLHSQDQCYMLLQTFLKVYFWNLSYLFNLSYVRVTDSKTFHVVSVLQIAIWVAEERLIQNKMDGFLLYIFFSAECSAVNQFVTRVKFQPSFLDWSKFVSALFIYFLKISGFASPASTVLHLLWQNAKGLSRRSLDCPINTQQLQENKYHSYSWCACCGPTIFFCSHKIMVCY